MASTEMTIAKSEVMTEQKNFRDLYIAVRRTIMQKYDIAEEVVLEKITEIIKLFKGGPWEFAKLDLNNAGNCCAYVKRFAAAHASLMFHVTLEILNNIPSRIISELLSNELKIVSIGGGPGNDIIGFCTALQKHPKFQIKNLNLTIVDLYEKWQEFFDASFTAAKEGEYGAITSLLNGTDFQTDFIPVDLTEDEIPEDVKQHALNKIKDADVILTVKLLSVMASIDKKMIILKEIYSKMKTNALLLIVDTNFRPIFSSRERYGIQDLYFSSLQTFRFIFGGSEVVENITYEVFVGRKITHVEPPEDIPS